MTNAVDLDVLDGQFNTRGEYIERIREATEDTFLESVPDRLEEEADLEWLNVLHERQDEIVVDNVIGTEGLDADDLIQDVEIIRVLVDDDRCHWSDGIYTQGTMLTLIGERIEEEFDTDTEFIEFVESYDGTELFADVDDIRELYRELRQQYEDQDDSPNSLLSLFTPDADLVFSRKYLEVGSFLRQMATQQRGWDNEPEVGQYAVMTVEVGPQHEDKTEFELGETFKIVGKFIDKKVEEVDLSDDFESDEEIIVEIPSYKFQTISYNSDILDVYPKHFLIESDEDAESRYISSSRETDITLHDENPLPLDDD